MRVGPIALCFAACNAPAPSPSLPWIGGLAATASGDTETAAAAQRLAAVAGTTDEDAYGAISVPTSFGTILASYRQGVAVVDAGDRVIARAPGFEAEGSADDLVAIAAGDAQLDKPVIVLAVTRGGHYESTTSIVVYQLGERGHLDQLFAAPIEEHVGDETVAGTLTFMPQGLLYRRPHGSLERWRFDPARRTYVREARFSPPAERDRPAPVL